MFDPPMTVVETERFLKDAVRLMADSEREEVVAFLGANPEAGDLSVEREECGNCGGGWPTKV